MTRYVMSIDLRRCVGCQTCTAACKNANATPPGVQWRRVLDLAPGRWIEKPFDFEALAELLERVAPWQ